MFGEWWTWLAWGLGLWVFVGLSGMVPVMALYFLPVVRVDEAEAERVYELPTNRVSDDWLEGEGFERAGVLRLMGMTIPGWVHREAPIFVAIYGAKPTIDIVTMLGERTGLTTGNTRDGALFPPMAGDFLQVFHGELLHRLWPRHLEAEQVLVGYGQVMAEPGASFQVHFQASVRDRARYMLFRPWLCLVVPWWYFVRRFRWSNISIQEQIDRGWIDPRETGVG